MVDTEVEPEVAEPEVAGMEVDTEVEPEVAEPEVAVMEVEPPFPLAASRAIGFVQTRIAATMSLPVDPRATDAAPQSQELAAAGTASSNHRKQLPQPFPLAASRAIGFAQTRIAATMSLPIDPRANDAAPQSLTSASTRTRKGPARALDEMTEDNHMSGTMTSEPTEETTKTEYIYSLQVVNTKSLRRFGPDA